MPGSDCSPVPVRGIVRPRREAGARAQARPRLPDAAPGSAAPATTPAHPRRKGQSPRTPKVRPELPECATATWPDDQPRHASTRGTSARAQGPHRAAGCAPRDAGPTTTPRHPQRGTQRARPRPAPEPAGLCPSQGRPYQRGRKEARCHDGGGRIAPHRRERRGLGEQVAQLGLEGPRRCRPPGDGVAELHEDPAVGQRAGRGTTGSSESSRPGRVADQPRPLTTTSTPADAGRPRSASSVGSSATSAGNDLDVGEPPASRWASAGFSSIARWRARGPRRRASSTVNAPEPAPSSTTTGAPDAGPPEGRVGHRAGQRGGARPHRGRGHRGADELGGEAGGSASRGGPREPGPGRAGSGGTADLRRGDMPARVARRGRAGREVGAGRAAAIAAASRRADARRDRCGLAVEAGPAPVDRQHPTVSTGGAPGDADEGGEEVVVADEGRRRVRARRSVVGVGQRHRHHRGARVEGGLERGRAGRGRGRGRSGSCPRRTRRRSRPSRSAPATAATASGRARSRSRSRNTVPARAAIGPISGQARTSDFGQHPDRDHAVEGEHVEPRDVVGDDERARRRARGRYDHARPRPRRAAAPTSPPGDARRAPGRAAGRARARPAPSSSTPASAAEPRGRCAAGGGRAATPPASGAGTGRHAGPQGEVGNQPPPRHRPPRAGSAATAGRWPCWSSRTNRSATPKSGSRAGGPPICGAEAQVARAAAAGSRGGPARASPTPSGPTGAGRCGTTRRSSGARCLRRDQRPDRPGQGALSGSAGRSRTR